MKDAFKGKKVLIVEDDALLLDIYKTKFAELGIEVATARDGAEGLSKVRSARPDAVLLDLVLPRMDGLEMLAAVRGAEEDVRKTPVVVVTNLENDAERSRAGALGASGYIIKARTSLADVIDAVAAAIVGRGAKPKKKR
jgi:CheY-like chemotaxis protein